MGKLKITPNKTREIVALIDSVFFKTDSRIFPQRNRGRVVTYIESMQERIRELETEVSIYKRMERDRSE